MGNVNRVCVFSHIIMPQKGVSNLELPWKILERGSLGKLQSPMTREFFEHPDFLDFCFLGCAFFNGFYHGNSSPSFGRISLELFPSATNSRKSKIFRQKLVSFGDFMPPPTGDRLNGMPKKCHFESQCFILIVLIGWDATSPRIPLNR